MSYTYATLTADVIANMEEDSDEFVSALPTIVQRAQAYLQRRVDSVNILRTATVSVSAGTRALTLPTDLLVLKSIQVSLAAGWTNLLQQTNEYLTAYWPVYTSVGQPKYYAPVDNTQVLLAPTPASATAAHVEYVAKVTVLTSAAPTNWFSENADAAFFAATMMYANLWTKNSAAVDRWKAVADEELFTLNNEARRARRSDDVNRSGGPAENNLGDTA